MTVIIDISDQEAAALSARAATQGLSLESWFRRLALQEASRTQSVSPGRLSVVEEMRRLRSSIQPDPEGWTTRDYVNHGRR